MKNYIYYILFIVLLISVAQSNDTGLSSADSADGKYPYSDPSANTMFLMPTAFVSPNGGAYYSNREIVFSEFGMNVGMNTQVTGDLLVYPVRIASLSIKHAFEKPSNDSPSMAVFFSSGFFFGEKIETTLIPGTVLTFGNHDDSFSLLGMYVRFVDINLFLFGGGSSSRLGKSSKFIFEYYGLLSDEPYSERVGVFTAGFRFFGVNSSVDFGLLGGHGGDDFGCVPFVRFVIHH